MRHSIILNRAITNLDSQNSRLKSDNSHLQTTIQRAKTSIIDLKHRNRSQERSIDDKNATIRRKDSDINNLLRDNTLLDTHARALAIANGNYRASNNILASHVSDLDYRNSRLS